MEVLRPARHVRLHEREPEALRDPAVDLALDLGRVDRPADVVGRDDPANLDGPELGIDLDLGDLGPERVGLVRHALAVGVERRRLADRTCPRRAGRTSPRRRRPDRGSSASSIAVAPAVRLGDPTRPPSNAIVASVPDLGEQQDLAAEVLAGEARGVAGHERLPRRRGLAGIGGSVGVAADQLDEPRGHAERVGRDLDEHRRGALADVDRAAEQDERARRA